MCGRMAAMLKFWIGIGALVFFGAVLGCAGVHGLMTGQLTVKRICSRRSEEPLAYWFITLLRIAFATLCFSVLLWMLSHRN